VTLCDPIWHVSSRSTEAHRKLLHTLFTYFTDVVRIWTLCLKVALVQLQRHLSVCDKIASIERRRLLQSSVPEHPL